MRDDAVLAFLAGRRSARPAQLTEPGPNATQLRGILTIAARVPDHKKLAPWRFIVFAGEARAAFGERLAEVVAKAPDVDASDVRLETERTRLLRAPVVVAVVSSPRALDKVPLIEQTLSGGACAFALCLAANAHGFATAWITEWISYNDEVRRAMGLAADEHVAGFVYIGSQKAPQADRDRPDIDAITAWWSPDDAQPV